MKSTYRVFDIRRVLMLLLFILAMLHFSEEYNLKNVKDIESYIKELTESFDKDVSDLRFSSIIIPPAIMMGRRQVVLPKVFLWSPQEQYAAVCKPTCPIHTHVALTPWQWTTSLDSDKGKKPRLIYDLFGNILLVQRIYLCCQGRQTHKIFASSPDLLTMLPETVKELFPMKLYQRSGCTKRLLSYIKNQITQGVNFLKISEGIGNLNHEEHTRLEELYSVARGDKLIDDENFEMNDFYSNDLFLFPSGDQIARMFLDDFKSYQNFYVGKMCNTSATRISCDHVTFKISRNIGIVSEGKESKFVTQFNNVFIVLNENGEVVDWRLTKSTAFQEIDDMLISLNERMRLNGKPISMIYTDDCCKNRNKYEGIFPEAEIKLDVFHACQRVLRTLKSRQFLLKTQFGKEFGLIFRQKDDLDEKRTKDTPDNVEIEANLDIFLEKWKNVPSSCLTQETLRQVENLREHIKKGCLSGIPPGFGTERNEQIQHLLNRSLLAGATRISVELAVALLTLLFYCYSCKASSNLNHQCNSKVKCILPARKTQSASSNVKTLWSPFKTGNSEKAGHSDWQGEQANIDDSGKETCAVDALIVVEDIDYLCRENISGGILNETISAQDIIATLANDNCDRSFHPDDLLIIANNPKGLTLDGVLYNYSDCCLGDEEDPTIAEHQARLTRHLAGLNRVIDDTARDGDCAFRSIVRMIKVSYSSDDKPLLEHLTALGLLKSEEEDISTLRKLFVEEILKGDEEFLSFIPTEDRDSLQMRAAEFRQNGVFDRSLGDLVMKVCAHVLKVPIMVVTSHENYPYVPFLPGSALTNRFIYVAYHYYGAGHYDATVIVEGANSDEIHVVTSHEEETGKVKGCTCGSNLKSRLETSCKTQEGQSSRCPCVRNGIPCMEQCKCRKCSNTTSGGKKPKLKPCRCGEGRKTKDPGFVSCIDVKGKKNTRCPCFSNRQGCSERCRCFSCNNSFGSSIRIKNDSQPKRKKQLSSPQSLKRPRGTQYLRDSGMTTV